MIRQSSKAEEISLRRRVREFHAYTVRLFVPDVSVHQHREFNTKMEHPNKE